MKASLKIREDQKPILKAKVPLCILGFPFRSGIEAGESKELSLSFSTLFESGPLFKFCYRPNDSWKPFGFVVKTGIGHFGSPIGAPMTMSAEFNFLGNGNPSFFLHFKPQIGDFLIKQSVSSQKALPYQPTKASISESKVTNGFDLGNNELSENKETPVKNEGCQALTGLFSGKGISSFPAVERFLSDGEVCASTVLPLTDRAVAKVRWSLRFPAEEDRAGDVWFRKIPYLMFSKIGIEHVAGDRKVSKRNSRGSIDVAETCLAVKRELDTLQVENGLLRKDMDELRSRINAGKCAPVAEITCSGESSEFERNGGRSLGEKKKQNKESKSNENGTTTGKA